MPAETFSGRIPRPYVVGSSDPGAGPSSDQEGRYGRPHRPYMPHDDIHYITDPQKLHEIIRSLRYRTEEDANELRRKDAAYQDQNKLFRDLNNRYQELYGRHEGALAHSRVLDDEAKRLDKEVKKARADADKYKEKYLQYKKEKIDGEMEIEKLAKENEKLKKKLKRSSTPPSPRDNGHGVKPEDPLAKRFEPRPKVSASTAGSGSTYYEPFGPPRPRRRNSVSATAGPRRFSTINVATHDDPQYSTLPRRTAGSDYAEPGEYVFHPLHTRH